MASILPWGVAFIALLALVATFAARSIGNAPASGIDESGNPPPSSLITGETPAAGTGGVAPDIGSLSLGERASRLYNRVMAYVAKGNVDSVVFFAPMALASHEMLQNPSIRERYHYGQLSEMTGNVAVVRAQADTILAARPTSLLGLLLASHAALMTKDVTAAHAFDKRFLDALASELATNNEDYTFHRAEIDQAAADLRRSNK